MDALPSEIICLVLSHVFQCEEQESLLLTLSSSIVEFPTPDLWTQVTDVLERNTKRIVNGVWDPKGTSLLAAYASLAESQARMTRDSCMAQRESGDSFNPLPHENGTREMVQTMLERPVARLVEWVDSALTGIKFNGRWYYDTAELQEEPIDLFNPLSHAACLLQRLNLLADCALVCKAFDRALRSPQSNDLWRQSAWRRWPQMMKLQVITLKNPVSWREYYVARARAKDRVHGADSCFDFECPRTLSDMKQTGPRSYYCSNCDATVHKIRDIEELGARAALGDCVSFDACNIFFTAHYPLGLFTGRPSPTWYKERKCE